MATIIARTLKTMEYMSVSDMPLRRAAMVPVAVAGHLGAMKTFSRLELSLLVLLGVFLLYISVNGFLFSAAAASGFGIPIVAPPDLFYLHIKADRDLASGIALFALLGFGERRALGIFVGALTVEPLFDLLLSVADERGRAAYALPVHGSAVLYGLVLAALLLRRRPAADPQ
jgi:hypothetical protein